MPNAPLTLIGRILLALIFLLAGGAKLADPAGTAGYFGSVGLPVPSLMAWLVGLFEIIGGLAILIGFQTRIAAVLLALFCVASAFIGHFDPENQMQMQAFMKNLAIAGGFLVLVAAGPGKLSIDGRAV